MVILLIFYIKLSESDINTLKRFFPNGQLWEEIIRTEKDVTAHTYFKENSIRRSIYYYSSRKDEGYYN